MTGASIDKTPTTSTARKMVRGVRMILGLVGLLVSAVWIGLTDNNLPRVLAVQQAVSEPSQAPEWKILMVLLMAISMIAVVGVWTFTTVDAGQLLGAAWAGPWLFVSMYLLHVAQFSGPDAGCTYASCWPSPFFELLVAAPFGVALIVMVVLAITGRPSRAPIRAGIPALVLLVLAAAQEWIWRGQILPILLGPPPF